MSRARILRSTQVVIDLLVLSGALWVAFGLRFDWDVPTEMWRRLLVLWPYVVALQYAFLVLTGVPRFAWRYVGLRETTRIAWATALASAILIAVRFLAADLFRVGGYAHYSYLPLGVIIIDFPLAFLGTVGVRVVRRITSEQAEVRRLRSVNQSQVRVLLVGAGRAGVIVAKEIAARPELGIVPVGFIDDDPIKLGTVVHGVRVLGGTADIQRLARVAAAQEAIITVSNAPGSAVRRISEKCQLAGLKVKVIPGLYQLMGGELNLTRIRDVAIEDLLRRDTVVLDDQAIRSELKGSVVLVTGAGGSIGSEICRQVCRFEPKLLLLVERSENALFEIHRELCDSYPNLELLPCVADICDAERLERLFAAHKPQVIFHAAAYKHVPMMEWNPCEAVKNNVFGTKTLVDTADRHHAAAFVMISTDKAVNPTSVMGATKRSAEIYVQSIAKASKTRFVTVRFGNVLGSNGSVVPIFREQIARGGPVKVTHPDMTRYFMTIPEACQLVLQAGSMGAGGEVFILDMGEPVRIVDLARDLIQLSGFQPDEIEVVFTGMRPGEKLYEEISVAEENAEKTLHPKIFIGKTRQARFADIQTGLERLGQALEANDEQLVRTALVDMIPEYRRSDAPPTPSLAPAESSGAHQPLPPAAERWSTAS